MSFPQYPEPFSGVLVTSDLRSLCKYPESGGDFQPAISPRAGETWAFCATVPGFLYADNEGGPDLPLFILPASPVVILFPFDVDNLKASDRSTLAPNGAGFALAWKIGP